MKAPSFWWHQRVGVAAIALAPPAWIYGSLIARQMTRNPSYWASVPVICVGNYTSGGDGKTPTAIALGRLVREMGLTPGFLTRGHGGSQRGPVEVEDGKSDPRQIGDEPALLAEFGPTVVARNRPNGARLLVGLGVDLIIMDDGLQNPGLGKDLSIAVIDAEAGLGNRRSMPAGPLRASLRTQLAATDIIVLIGEGPSQSGMVRLAARAGKKLLRAALAPVELDGWRNGRILAFAGIGRAEKFFASLERCGAQFAGQIAFDDHHFYSKADAKALLRHADVGSDIRLVTTEKDYARLASAEGTVAELRERAEIFAIQLRFDPPSEMRRMLGSAIEAARTGGGRRRSAI
ncbi:MAG: tetraacyldisaccharide 4'-kinase [Alphaproteobacteria bacterium]